MIMRMARKATPRTARNVASWFILDDLPSKLPASETVKICGNLHGVLLNPTPSARTHARFSLCVALAVLGGMPVNAQTPTERSLSAIERRISAYVKAHEREQIDFLEKAV